MTEEPEEPEQEPEKDPEPEPEEDNEPEYRCADCGYEYDKKHAHCPSCGEKKAY